MDDVLDSRKVKRMYTTAFTVDRVSKTNVHSKFTKQLFQETNSPTKIELHGLGSPQVSGNMIYYVKVKSRPLIQNFILPN